MEGFVERWMRHEELRPVGREKVMGHDVIFAHSDLPHFDQPNDEKLSSGYYTIGFAIETPGFNGKSMAIVRTDFVPANDEELISRDITGRSMVLKNTAREAAKDFIRNGKAAEFLHA